MNIAGRAIGRSEPVYLIAEAGANHGGDVGKFAELIEAAAHAGADAVKGQFFRADRMVVPEHPDYETYRRYEVPEDWLPYLSLVAKKAAITLFWSVFSPEDVELLERVCPPPAYKIASAELTYTDLLEAVAATGKPVILSTAMATVKQVQLAMDAMFQVAMQIEVGCLHCVSAYPAPPEDMNLRCMDDLDHAGSLTGLSDHTAEPFTAPLMAAALGASIIEKHFRLPDSEGPDAPFSILPDQLAALAMALHSAHLLMGDGVKRVMPSEREALADRRTLQGGRWLRGLPSG